MEQAIVAFLTALTALVWTMKQELERREEREKIRRNSERLRRLESRVYLYSADEKDNDNEG